MSAETSSGVMPAARRMRAPFRSRIPGEKQVNREPEEERERADREKEMECLPSSRRGRAPSTRLYIAARQGSLRRRAHEAWDERAVHVVKCGRGARRSRHWNIRKDETEKEPRIPGRRRLSNGWLLPRVSSASGAIAKQHVFDRPGSESAISSAAPSWRRTRPAPAQLDDPVDVARVAKTLESGDEERRSDALTTVRGQDAGRPEEGRRRRFDDGETRRFAGHGSPRSTRSARGRTRPMPRRPNPRRGPTNEGIDQRPLGTTCPSHHDSAFPEPRDVRLESRQLEKGNEQIAHPISTSTDRPKSETFCPIGPTTWPPFSSADRVFGSEVRSRAARTRQGIVRGHRSSKWLRGRPFVCTSGPASPPRRSAHEDDREPAVQAAFLQERRQIGSAHRRHHEVIRSGRPRSRDPWTCRGLGDVW